MKIKPATVSEPSVPPGRELSESSAGFRVAETFKDSLAKLGLDSLEAVFAFRAGRDLAKPGMRRFRRRLQFEATPAGTERPVTVYLKCYDRPPILAQLRNWLAQRRRGSFALLEQETADRLAAAGIDTPRTVACGDQWHNVFEYRSFLMTEQVQDSRSLESALPPCFYDPSAGAERQARRVFVRRLASFIRRFHQAGYRHRDLYLSHIFYSNQGEFCLIDLARAFRPVRRRRFQVKDIAQLYYSAPAAVVSKADRLRFYLAYVDRTRLVPEDRTFIRQIVSKARRMARHNRKRGNRAPFLDPTGGKR